MLEVKFTDVDVEGEHGVNVAKKNKNHLINEIASRSACDVYCIYVIICVMLDIGGVMRGLVMPDVGTRSPPQMQERPLMKQLMQMTHQRTQEQSSKQP